MKDIVTLYLTVPSLQSNILVKVVMCMYAMCMYMMTYTYVMTCTYVMLYMCQSYGSTNDSHGAANKEDLVARGAGSSHFYAII